MQFVELSRWIPRFNINYHLGVDGISGAVHPVEQLHHRAGGARGLGVDHTAGGAVHGGLPHHVGPVERRVRGLDAMLFYTIFEATLIPMYLVIGVWGGPNRVYAAVKFFLYTLLGSLLMLVAFLYLYDKSGGSFSISTGTSCRWR